MSTYHTEPFMADQWQVSFSKPTSYREKEGRVAFQTEIHFQHKDGRELQKRTLTVEQCRDMVACISHYYHNEHSATTQDLDSCLSRVSNEQLDRIKAQVFSNDPEHPESAAQKSVWFELSSQPIATIETLRQARDEVCARVKTLLSEVLERRKPRYPREEEVLTAAVTDVKNRMATGLIGYTMTAGCEFSPEQIHIRTMSHGGSAVKGHFKMKFTRGGDTRIVRADYDLVEEADVA